MLNCFSIIILAAVSKIAWCKDLPQVHHENEAAVTLSTSMNVAQLNRHIFAGNVLQPMGGGVQTWVVLFCPNWFEPCQKLEPLFHDLAKSWQQRQNMDSSFTRMRFAQVDCAVDKTLCNEQHVTTYPFVAIYGDGQQLHTSGIKRKQDMLKQMEQLLQQWLKSSQVSSDASSESVLPKVLEDFYQHRAMDVVLTLVALAVSLQFMRSNSNFFPGTDAPQQRLDMRRPIRSDPTTKIIEF